MERTPNVPLAKRLLIALPAIHASLLVITMITGERTASGGTPLFSVELPISLPLVATDNFATILIVGILATLWWYFIAQIGWVSTGKRISRISAGLGALLIVFMCLVDAVMMLSELACCTSHEPNFSVIDGLIYVFAFTLLCGGLISAGYSARAALGLNKV
jgi:hypothetical protein